MSIVTEKEREPRVAVQAQRFLPRQHGFLDGVATPVTFSLSDQYLTSATWIQNVLSELTSNDGHRFLASRTLKIPETQALRGETETD